VTGVEVGRGGGRRPAPGRGRRLATAAFGALVVAALAACGGGGDDGAGSAPTLAAAGAWARPTPATADEGVVYLTVTSDEADAVVGAAVAPSVAEEVQLHQTTGGGAGGGHDHGAVVGGDDAVTMGEVAELAVTPDEPLVFEPGGNHVMVVGLAAPLEQGDRIELTLELRSGRTLAVDVPVQPNPPG
jgi:copper(I)-binding protein